MTVRAVLFDLGNTLVHYYRGAAFLPILRLCLERTAAALGRTASDELYEQALLLDHEDPSWVVRPLFGRIRALFPELDEPRVAQLCRVFMAPIFECARLDEQALRVLEKLRAMGLKTAIVSNTPWGSSAALWRAELARHGLLQRVDAAVFCVDAGWRKPHPAPFALALARLEVPAGEAIFVGDDPRWDVEGARRSQLEPVLLDPNEAPRADCVVIRDLERVISLVSERGQLGRGTHVASARALRWRPGACSVETTALWSAHERENEDGDPCQSGARSLQEDPVPSRVCGARRRAREASARRRVRARELRREPDAIGAGQ